MKDTVCIYSGGMDSYTMVALAHRQGRLHSCLGFDYGQRHLKELISAQNVCLELNVPYLIINLMPILLGGLTLTALATDAFSPPPLPTDHFADISQRITCVPNRNMVMLSAAIAYAVMYNLRTVQYGAHAGDREVYPDCRREFVTAMDAAARLANWHPVRVQAPFLEETKVGILSTGLAMGLDYSKTWTCYKGGSISCGKCGSCQERLTAFKELGQPDPLAYESDSEHLNEE